MKKYISAPRQSGKTTQIINSLEDGDGVLLFKSDEVLRIKRLICSTRVTELGDILANNIFTPKTILSTLRNGELKIKTLYIDEFPVVACAVECMDIVIKMHDKKIIKDIVAVGTQYNGYDIEKVKFVKILMEKYHNADEFMKFIRLSEIDEISEIIRTFTYIFDEIEVLTRYKISV